MGDLDRAIAALTASTDLGDQAAGWLLAEIRQHHAAVPPTVAAAAAHLAQAALPEPAPITTATHGLAAVIALPRRRPVPTIPGGAA